RHACMIRLFIASLAVSLTPGLACRLWTGSQRQASGVRPAARAQHSGARSIWRRPTRPMRAYRLERRTSRTLQRRHGAIEFGSVDLTPRSEKWAGFRFLDGGSRYRMFAPTGLAPTGL